MAGLLHRLPRPSLCENRQGRFPRQRLRDLQSGCPVELFIMATTKDFTEDILHKRFDHSRVRGEWFKLDWELQNFINQLPGS